jgi:hypothetical protein
MLEKFSAFVHRNIGNKQLFPKEVKFHPSDEESETSSCMSNQRFLWFHFHATNKDGLFLINFSSLSPLVFLL